MKNSLTAIIITKNEEESISRCLKSVSFVDEIVIVDSGSVDKTLEIAKKYDAKIFKKEFDNYASQRNYAISKANSRWILSLDADEEIPNALSTEIREAINNHNFDGYLIPRRNIIFGKEIKHTRWGPDKHVWLFKKDKGKFINSIHEEVHVNGKVGELVNAKLHHSHKNIYEFIEMLNNYTSLEAQELANKGVRFSCLKLFYFPLRSFFGRYFLKLGFLDGWRGFVLSYLRAIYQFTVWVKIWQMQKSSR